MDSIGWLLMIVGAMYVVAPKAAYVLLRSRTPFRQDPLDPGPRPSGPRPSALRLVGATLGLVGLALVVVA